MTGLCNPRVNLLSGEVPPFSRFCSLGHLDLDFFCTYKVLAGHTEPSGCYLFDGRTAVLSVSSHRQPFRAFSALSAVGLAAQHIHGNGKSLMSLS